MKKREEKVSETSSYWFTITHFNPSECLKIAILGQNFAKVWHLFILINIFVDIINYRSQIKNPPGM